MYLSSTFLPISIFALFGTTCLAAPIDSSPVKRDAPVPSIAGAPVVFGPGTYPRANKLSGGGIIGVYTAFNGGDSIIETVLSNDDGQSWTYQGEVTRGATNANDIDNPYVLQLPSGRLLCAIRNHSKDPGSGAYTYFRITITYSDDNGKSWAFLSQPASDPGPVTGSWEPFLRNAQDGSLQLYYSRENSAADQDTLERFSNDGGKTWTDAQTISGTGITARDGMTGVVTVSGSTVMAVFESESTGTFTINAITSNDDGKTWGDRKTIYTPSNPNTSAGAPQIVCVGNNLAVSFMYVLHFFNSLYSLPRRRVFG